MFSFIAYMHLLGFIEIIRVDCTIGGTFYPPIKQMLFSRTPSKKTCAKIMLMIRNMGIIMIISPIWPRFCITYSFHLADAFNNLFHRCSVVFAVIGSNSKHHQLKLSKLIRIEREREKKARSTETTLNNRLVWPHMRNIEKKIGESMARTHP